MSDAAVFRTYLGEALEARLQDGLRHALALGAEGAEAFVSVSRSRRAKVQNGALEDLTTSKRGGLGVRVLRGGPKGLRTGIATSTDLTRPDFKELFAQAWELSALGDEDRWIRQADPAGADDLPSRFDPRADALTAEERIERALALEAEARAGSSQVAAVREATWADGAGASLLLTQKGVRAFDLASSCSASIELVVAAGAHRVEELYRLAGDGVLITEIMGLHTVDPVSGDLSVGASGVRIRDGALAETVDRMTFAGNLKDFLTRIVALGDDLRWYGSSAGLSLLLEDISLGGA